MKNCTLNHKQNPELNLQISVNNKLYYPYKIQVSDLDHSFHLINFHKTMLLKAISLAIILVSLFSCNIPAENESNSKCNVCPPTKDTVVLDFGKTQLLKILDVFRIEGTDVSYSSLKKMNYEQIYSIIAKEFNIQEASPYSIIIYTNTFFSEIHRIELSDIIGVSIFYVDNSYLNHKIYLKKQDEIHCVEDLTCRVNRIYASDIYNITFYLFPSNEFPNRSWIALHPEDAYAMKYNMVRKNYLEKKLEKLNKLKSNVNPMQKCNAPCVEAVDGMCYYNPVRPPFWNCDSDEPEEPCLEEQVHNIIKTSDVSFDSTVFNTVLHTEFRDSIIKDSVGLRLTEDYYLLSSYFFYKIDFFLAKKSFHTIEVIN